MVTTDVLLAILRITIGALIFGHGAQKLFGWFGGNGMAGTQGMTRKLGFYPSWFWAWALSLGEVIGGLLLVFGFLPPIGAALVIGAMIVAIATVHGPKGLWVTNGGYEYNILIIGAALVVGLADPAAYSLDYYLKFGWTPMMLFQIA